MEWGVNNMVSKAPIFVEDDFASLLAELAACEKRLTACIEGAPAKCSVKCPNAFGGFTTTANATAASVPALGDDEPVFDEGPIFDEERIFEEESSSSTTAPLRIPSDPEQEVDDLDPAATTQFLLSHDFKRLHRTTPFDGIGTSNLVSASIAASPSPWSLRPPPRRVHGTDEGGNLQSQHSTNSQLLEFAWGLANSGYPFVWNIRPDLVKGDSAVLPPEFASAVEGHALLTTWCPQEAALQHEAVGVFLTHFGWNSTLESLCAGLPILSWPFFAEQQTTTACSLVALLPDIRVVGGDPFYYDPDDPEVMGPEVRERVQQGNTVAPHPNVIALHDVYEDARGVHLVLELCSGCELFDRIVGRDRDRRYSELDAAGVVRQIARGLQALHGDRKPENCLFADRGKGSTLKIMDFGLSSVEDFSDPVVTLFGSIDYVSPEALSRQDVSAASDMWSVGRMLQGEFSFQYHTGKTISSSAKELISSLLSVEPYKRPTASDLLGHPWVIGNCAKQDLMDAEVVSKLQRFNARRAQRTKRLRNLLGRHDLRSEELDNLNNEGIRPDIVMYNALIDSHCTGGNMERAYEIMTEVEKKRISPDDVTYNTLMRGFCLLGRLDEARTLIDARTKKGIQPDLVSYNMRISGYSMKGDMKDALRVRDEMMDKGFNPTLLTYNVLIQGLCKNGQRDDAENLMKKMVAKGITPETYLDKIYAHSSIGQLQRTFGTLHEFENAYRNSEDVDVELFSPVTSLHPLVVACCNDGSTMDAVSSGQGNFSVFLWDPGGHAKNSLGTSCISRSGECQVTRWAVGHAGPRLFCGPVLQEREGATTEGTSNRTTKASSSSLRRRLPPPWFLISSGF